MWMFLNEVEEETVLDFRCPRSILVPIVHLCFPTWIAMLLVVCVAVYRTYMYMYILTHYCVSSHAQIDSEVLYLA